MRHSSVVVLDSFMREAWYNLGPFALGTALRASAKQGTALRQEHSDNRDSSSSRNVHGQVVRGLWWIRNVK